MNNNIHPPTMAKFMRAAAPIIASAAATAAGAVVRKSRRRKRRRRKQTANRDTTFQAPVSRGRIIRNSVAPSIRIRHREYLMDVDVTTGTDYRHTMAINPGITFPWLAGIAANFEKYRMHSLKFEYVTATATSTTGAIALAPEYDPDDLDFTLSKRNLYMFDGIVRGPLWESLTLPFRCPRKEFFVRQSNSDESLKWHDPGQLIIDVSSPSVTAVIGEIWVEYDVTLRIPEYETIDVPVSISDLVTAWTTVSAGATFVWGGTIPYNNGLKSKGMLPLATYEASTSCYLSCDKPGTYQIVMALAGATTLTGMSAAGMSGYIGGEDAITSVSSTVNAAGTAGTFVFSLTVGPTYDTTYYTYTRDAAHPLVVYLGLALAAVGPTSVQLYVS